MYQLRRLVAHIPQLDSVERVRRNHCLLSNLAWQYCTPITLVSTIRRRYSCTLHPIKMSSGKSSDDWVMPPSSSKKQKLSFESSPLPPSRATASAGHLPLENWRLRPQKQINFLCSERRPPSPSSNSLEAKGRSIRGRKPEDPTYPVETTRASTLPGRP